MTTKQSAGIVLYRIRPDQLEVFLVHPGGPYWAGKDEGAWSIPKGEIPQGDEPLQTAKREFAEETGSPITGEFRALGTLKQPSGKVIHAWAVEGDLDPGTVKSNLFSMEWPPRSGIIREFPEVDCGAWFDMAAAARKLSPGQRPFLDALPAPRSAASPSAGSATARAPAES